MVNLAVEVNELRREFTGRRGKDRVVALDGISLDIVEGETFGLLGPNGAGKTTLVKILATVLLPTSGTARVLGHDVERDPGAVRPVIGLVFGGDRGLYTRVSARANLMFWAALYRLGRRAAKQRTNELLDQFGLADRADEPVERFSRGMKQRLHLARGLIHEPRVLFLDEPTVGLDPAAAHEVWAIVRRLRSEGRTVLLATHDMAEAAELCDRVSMLDRGSIQLVEQPAAVGRLLSGGGRFDFETADPAVADAFARLAGVESVEPRGDGAYRAVVTADADARRDLLRWLLDRDVVDVQTSKPSLEEVYLHVLGGRGMLV
jgi:ABC-2 type transport system ATP-binding protein